MASMPTKTLFALGLLAGGALAPAAPPAPAARIKIDTERVIGEVHPHVFGNFAEHLGRCIYGGIFEEGSALADASGFRQDVMEATRRLKVPIIRCIGGNTISVPHLPKFHTGGTVPGTPGQEVPILALAGETVTPAGGGGGGGVLRIETSGGGTPLERLLAEFIHQAVRTGVIQLTVRGNRVAVGHG